MLAVGVNVKGMHPPTGAPMILIVGLIICMYLFLVIVVEQP